jgi:hypothetical protein
MELVYILTCGSCYILLKRTCNMIQIMKGKLNNYAESLGFHLECNLILDSLCLHGIPGKRKDRGYI